MKVSLSNKVFKYHQIGPNMVGFYQSDSLHSWNCKFPFVERVFPNIPIMSSIQNNFNIDESSMILVHVICVNEFQNRIPITAAYQGQNARTLWYSTGMLWCGMVLCTTRHGQVRSQLSAGL